ncbi:MAG: HNH endonuclease [Mesorhizobium sp.]|uniref:HNH endonuclease n=1 Tax=Mesorhizobium sp. TaxID=1871066 RepID=UPI000FE62A02|nr:HNH endonuclease signature motif containing protein [Mesorhizobium sp.]RWC90044.1 MAG: HNH endonuclease [Mesorhizobium sp.]
MGMKHGRAGYSVYRSKQWQALRLAAKRRDGFKCTSCGSRGRLEVHHDKPVRQAPELAYDLHNLKCLCASCHTKQTMAERGYEPKPARVAWLSLLRKEIPQCSNP